MPRFRRTSRPLVTAVVFLMVAAVLTAGWITIKELQVQKSVYAKILQQKIETSRAEFRFFLQPVQNHLQTIGHWHDHGLLTLSDDTGLTALLGPLTVPTDHVSAVYLIPAEGPMYHLNRTADGVIGGFADAAADTYRTTGWYEQARASNQPGARFWADYHPLCGDGRHGLLVSARFGDLVVALGILEADINLFAASVPVTENGILVRRFVEGRITWLSPGAGNQLRATSTDELLTSSSPELSTIGQALMTWGQLQRPYQTPFRFKHHGTTWWCAFYQSVEGGDPGELGLVVPADDLQRRLQTVTGRVTLLLSVIVVLAMVVVVALAFDYRNKWRRFAARKRKSPDTEEALAELIAGGESMHVEFKSTMRWNLHSDKPGKEIEKAWLKNVVAFLNSDGGHLVIGARDDGSILGLEADKFQSDDKYLLHFENLIKQHIGLEFASYVHPEIRSIGEERMLLVSCDRCSEPVFLRIGNEEAFYVRIGPSSHQLPASKILDYLREKQS